MGKTSWDMDDSLEAELEAHLSYGDRKKDVYNQAIRMWLHVSPMLDELYESQDREKRLQFVEAAVRQEIDRVKENPNYDGPNGGPPGE